MRLLIIRVEEQNLLPGKKKITKSYPDLGRNPHQNEHHGPFEPVSAGKGSLSGGIEAK